MKHAEFFHIVSGCDPLIKGYRISFERRDNGILISEFFPEDGLLNDLDQTRQLALKLRSSDPSGEKFVNIMIFRVFSDKTQVLLPLSQTFPTPNETPEQGTPGSSKLTLTEDELREARGEKLDVASAFKIIFGYYPLLDITNIEDRVSISVIELLHGLNGVITYGK